MVFIKKIIRKLNDFFCFTSDEYIKLLRKRGVKIGENVRFFSPDEIHIDLQHPNMIIIGDNVRITKGVSILCHDYSFSVCACIDGEVFSNIGKVEIGDNVFIGVNSTILKGTKIGNNTIIGANTVVSGNLEGGYVYVGNPCRRLMSLNDYREKRIKKQEKELNEYITSYINTYKAFPPEDKLFEYIYLFKRNIGDLNEKEKEFLYRIGNDKIIDQFENHNSIYRDYNDLKNNFIN